MTIPVAITAAPRDGDVQARSFASVVRAGFTDVSILAEPCTRIPWDTYRRASITVHQTRKGQWWNFICALEHLLRMSNAERLCTMEDDVIFCRNVAALLERERWPSHFCGCIQVYSAAHYDRYALGLVKLEVEDALDMLSACCLLFSRPAAERLVVWAHEKGWRGHTYEKSAALQTKPEEKEGADTFVGEVLTYLGYEIWIYNPSLAQHIGDVSTLGHPGGTARRTALNWPGEDADALELCSMRKQHESSSAVQDVRRRRMDRDQPIIGVQPR